MTTLAAHDARAGDVAETTHQRVASWDRSRAAKEVYRLTMMLALAASAVGAVGAAHETFIGTMLDDLEVMTPESERAEVIEKVFELAHCIDDEELPQLDDACLAARATAKRLLDAATTDVQENEQAVEAAMTAKKGSDT